ncbi:DUF4435 domain-containing protein [Chryseobacterium sp. RLHN22]|uniref:DUF4435 domain-containing protein n=1 Tax=Chryseobacterium sp. RLHN22 TaxID=3437885 RepID=UPI003D9BF213
MSDNIVEKLRSESENEHVAYTQFMLSYKKNQKNIYAFYEGLEDRFYYPIRIETIVYDKELKDFICNGKGNVVKVHNLIKNSAVYKEVSTLFFIDSDFDNNNYANTIYVTPTYSIENFFITEKCLAKILIAEFKFTPESPDFVKCMKMYRELLNKYISIVNNLNIWLACQADIRNTNKQSTRLNIDKNLKDLFPKNILDERLENINQISEISTIENIEKIFSSAQKIDAATFEKKLAAFSSENKTSRFRGKFFLKLLELFLFRLQSLDYKKHSDIFEKKYSCNLKFDYATLCSNLSQYASTPNCLREYITGISKN